MKYWTFTDHKPNGPFELADLPALPGFGPTSQVCKVGDDVWQQAEKIPEIAAFISPHKVTRTFHVEVGDAVDDKKDLMKDWSPRTVLAAPVSTTPRRSTFVPVRPPTPPAKRRNRIRNKWTMALLWTFFFGLYMPQMDQLYKMAESAIELSLDVPAQGFIRWAKHKGRTGWRKTNSVIPQLPPAAKVSAGKAAKKGSKQKKAPRRARPDPKGQALS